MQSGASIRGVPKRSLGTRSEELGNEQETTSRLETCSTSRGLRGGAGVTGEQGDELGSPDRLGGVVVAAGFQTSLPVVGHGVRGESHDRPDITRRTQFA